MPKNPEYDRQFMSLLGIDIGTSGSKVMAVSADGRVYTFQYLMHETRHSDAGHMEIDSSRLWNNVQELILRAAAATKHDPVQALCVSSFGEACVPVTKDRKILADIILGTDCRGRSEIDDFLNKIPAEDFYRICPNIPGIQYTLPKILWIKKNNPELYRAADFFLLIGDFIGFMLGAEPYASTSLACRTLLFDLDAGNWSDRLLTLAGLPRGKFGRILSAGKCAGEVTPVLAEKLKLPGRIKILAGGHDQCLNALGSGAINAGSAVCGIGTYECITPVFSAVREKKDMFRQNLNIGCHVVPELFVSFIYNQAGSLVKWFRDTFAQKEKNEIPQDEIFSALSGEMPEGPSGLLVLPCFEPAGAPLYVSDAKGAITGLTTSTRRGDILKAIMESSTFYFYEALEKLSALDIKTENFTVTGGGSKSDSWLKIHADIFGMPFIRPEISEASVLGAALLAGTGLKIWASLKEASVLFCRTDRIFFPDREQHIKYQELFQKYKKLFPLLYQFLRKM
ncbi:MAG: hypothetical protein A2096_13435 [Spirochaetes bacterium GWF1_41_5]|nr:MAG: hypothetical protein A2096_13435 [Spirochaetes bacterium GWF1_41_5]HBE01482.1 hypothetical protein [Spirochaetia bacterium]